MEMHLRGCYNCFTMTLLVDPQRKWMRTHAQSLSIPISLFEGPFLILMKPDVETAKPPAALDTRLADWVAALFSGGSFSARLVACLEVLHETHGELQVLLLISGPLPSAPSQIEQQDSRPASRMPWKQPVAHTETDNLLWMACAQLRTPYFFGSSMPKIDSITMPHGQTLCVNQPT